MKNVSIVVAGIALVGMAILSDHGVAVPAPAPGKPEVVKWEYGRLQHSARSCAWTLAGEEVLADTDAELAEKLKVAIPDKATPSMIKVAIFNHLGNQGWEMVSVDRATGPGATARTASEYYTFKRRVMPKE